MGLGSISVLVLVVTITWAEVLPGGRVTEVGGLTMSWGPAVPPAVRFTVRELDGAEDAEISYSMGAPWLTLESRAAMVSTGPGVAAGSTDVTSEASTDVGPALTCGPPSGRGAAR